jgi:putative nucleotidyltransferase with HDIG domain
MPTGQLRTYAKVYIGIVVLAGAVAIGHSFYELATKPVGFGWVLLAALTLVSGSATVRLPSVPATITVSETFVFTSVLLFGPAAGTLTVTLDALVISFWLSRKGHPLYRVLFNVAALPVAMWVGAHLFYSTAQIAPLLSRNAAESTLWQLVPPLLLFAATYFTLNSGLIAIAISFEKGGFPLSIWRDNFAWLFLNYFGGAFVAVLLVTYTRNEDFPYLSVIVPLIVPLLLYLTFTASMGRAEDANRHLSQLNKLYMSTIETLAMAIDAKDQITHGHIRRVQQYAVALAKAVGIREEAQLRAIEAAALLHDMGKLAVPEYILNKPGPLTPAEFDKMKLHASVGADILSSIDFPYPVVPMVRHHHENWDGSGYPAGLLGADIPIGARILAVVDCFDALTSDRPYRPRLSDADAIKILRDRRGVMYDPLIVDSFLKVHAEMSPVALLQSGVGLSAITDASQQLSTAAELPRLGDISASTEETATLYELAKDLGGQNKLDEAVDRVFSQVRRLVPTSTFVVYRYDEVHDHLAAIHARGEHVQVFHDLRIPLGQRLTGWVGANRQTILNSDPVLDLGDASRNLKPRLRTCLSTPLITKGELVGVLSLYSTDASQFTEDNRRIVEAVSTQLAHILRHTGQAEGTLNRQPDSSTDGTRTEGKALFGIAIEGELKHPFGLVQVELTGLKALRDEGSYAKVEAIVERVATLTRRVLRPEDTLRHVAPNELVVLLRQTDAVTCAAISGRLAAVLADDAVVRDCSARVFFAAAPTDGRSVEELLHVLRKRPSDARAMRSNEPPDSQRLIH